jgi:signal transduction histidine kinase
VSHDLLLFAQLVVFLTGTVLYGFLLHDLVRQPGAFSGAPMRLLAACLGIWYAGCFAAVVMDVLLPDTPERFDTAFGLVRGFAWLASFPLLAHTARALTARRTAWAWLLPGYLSLLLFVPAATRAWQTHGVPLAETARQLYPWIVLYAVGIAVITAGLLLGALRQAPDPRQAHLVRWLLAGLGVMAALIAAGALVLPPVAIAADGSGGASWGEALWRLSAEIAGLVLGLVFLAFVQRYSLLRLSLSRRGVRRFLYVLGATMLLILAGPAVGIAGTDASRRLVAGGVLVALAAAAAATPAERAARRHFPALRRLIGQTVGAEEIEALTRRLRSLSLSDRELRALTEEELARWLGVPARFLTCPPESPPAGLPPSAGAAAAAPRLLWDHFLDPAARAFSRLDAPAPRLAAELDRADLQAAFPLRLSGVLDSVLGLAIGDAAAGYEEGEREVVQIVVNQLAAALEVRQVVEARLAGERRLAEHERLSLLGLVSASLAHELKNPLSAMKVLAQTVHEELARDDPGGDQAQDLRLIVEQIDRLHEVAREILSFARQPVSPSGPDGFPDGSPDGFQDGAAGRAAGALAGAPDGAARAGGVALTALLRGTLYVLRHLARQRGVEITADEIADVGRVRGTAAAWQTVLFNLALNAVEHAPAGSAVTVRLCREAAAPPGQAAPPDECPGGVGARGAAGAAVRFETENAGRIDAGLAARLFEPFASHAGTGLGLTLVAQRVRELGGEVKLDGVPGCVVFRVRVPA